MKWKIYKRQTSYWRKRRWINVQQNFRRQVDRKKYSKAKWELVGSYDSEKSFQEAWKTIEKRKNAKFFNNYRFYNYKYEVKP